MPPSGAMGVRGHRTSSSTQQGGAGRGQLGALGPQTATVCPALRSLPSAPCGHLPFSDPASPSLSGVERRAGGRGRAARKKGSLASKGAGGLPKFLTCFCLKFPKSTKRGGCAPRLQYSGLCSSFCCRLLSAGENFGPALGPSACAHHEAGKRASAPWSASLARALTDLSHRTGLRAPGA